MATVPFSKFNTERGDLIVVSTPDAVQPVIVGNGYEQLDGGYYRVYFSFVAQGKLFDSSTFCTEDEIVQVVRNGATVWSRLGS